MIEEIAAHFADLAELLVRVPVERLELPLVHERVVVVVHDIFRRHLSAQRTRQRNTPQTHHHHTHPDAL